jgi:hypothetical protein
MNLDPPLPEQISNEAIRRPVNARRVMAEVCRAPIGAESWLTSLFQDKQK